VTIEAKVVEITGTDNKAVGFDWFLGNHLQNPGGPGGLAPTTITGLDTDPGAAPRLLKPGGRPATVTGILTDPQFRVVIRALEQRANNHLIAMPRITTLSGRQAQITLDESISFDCLPKVRADGYTIEMNIGFTYLEPHKQSGNQKPLPLKRQLTSSALIWDGQTVVLGGFPIGNQAPDQKKTGSRKNLVVFLTPTIIDPAGNRVHAGSEPFDPNSTPHQEPPAE
jgi:type II secretory pathway component GspD/PulD (secretin)